MATILVYFKINFQIALSPFLFNLESWDRHQWKVLCKFYKRVISQHFWSMPKSQPRSKVELLNYSIFTSFSTWRVGTGTAGKLSVSSSEINHHGCHGKIFGVINISRTSPGWNFQIVLSPLLFDLESCNWNCLKALCKQHWN